MKPLSSLSLLFLVACMAPPARADLQLWTLNAFSELPIGGQNIYIDFDSGQAEAADFPTVLIDGWDLSFRGQSEFSLGGVEGQAEYRNEQYECELFCHDSNPGLVKALGVGVGVDSTLPGTSFQTSGYLNTFTGGEWQPPTHAYIGFRRDAGGGNYNYGFIEAEVGSLTIIGFGFETTQNVAAVTQPVPEPGVGILALAGLAGIGLARLRRKTPSGPAIRPASWHHDVSSP